MQGHGCSAADGSRRIEAARNTRPNSRRPLLQNSRNWLLAASLSQMYCDEGPHDNAHPTSQQLRRVIICLLNYTPHAAACNRLQSTCGNYAHVLH